MIQNLQNPEPEVADAAKRKDFVMDRQSAAGSTDSEASGSDRKIAIALLTGGSDRPYVLGLTTEIVPKGVAVDLIGSDELDLPEFRDQPGINFLNLRGDQRTEAGFLSKLFRISRYYAALIRYAATAKPKIFHILWNNKFETLDRTLLMLYYRFLGKKIVLTAHNVNTNRRDSKDTPLNRLTLRIQHRLADHIFVHTEGMRAELVKEFGVHESRITVIPFGINNTVPNTDLTPGEAKRRLGIRENEKAILFFGRIKPYKGLEYLVSAIHQHLARPNDYRLIIAGMPDTYGSNEYWTNMQEVIREHVLNGSVLLEANFISDEETEVYFKAADVLVLPYRSIYQSGVLFLGYSFGLPVLVADVGALKDEVIEGETGFVFAPEDPVDLAKAIERYFTSDLFANLGARRQRIRDFAAQTHSWDLVGERTIKIYSNLLELTPPKEPRKRKSSTTPVEEKVPD